VSASTSPRPTSATGYLLAGVLGGLVVLVVGAILLATGVIDTGKETKIVRQESISRPASTSDSKNAGRTVADIYKNEGKGVVFVQAKGVSSSDTFGLPQQGTATGSGFVVSKDG
jgi:hypothetical protein